MSTVDAFFADVDREWARGPTLTLRLIGSTALMLQSDYRRGTKDGDVLLTDEISSDVERRFVAIAGRGSLLHQRHAMYLEFVHEAFPFLPTPPLWHKVTRLTTSLNHLRIEALDVTDVAVAKLARFHRTDRDDIAAVIARDLLPVDRFEARFVSAIERWWYDARAEELPRIVRNFHQVQSDMLGVEPTAVALPPWVEDP